VYIQTVLEDIQTIVQIQKLLWRCGSLKLYAGNGVTPKININGGVGIAT
jgi:hypothetical protein